VDENTLDPLAILAVTGGERQTDNFELFPKLLKDTGNRSVCRFFIRGLQHCNELARERALSLQSGEELQISVELNIFHPGYAGQLHPYLFGLVE